MVFSSSISSAHRLSYSSFFSLVIGEPILIPFSPVCRLRGGGLRLPFFHGRGSPHSVGHGHGLSFFSSSSSAHGRHVSNSEFLDDIDSSKELFDVLVDPRIEFLGRIGARDDDGSSEKLSVSTLEGDLEGILVEESQELRESREVLAEVVGDDTLLSVISVPPPVPVDCFIADVRLFTKTGSKREGGMGLSSPGCAVKPMHSGLPSPLDPRIRLSKLSITEGLCGVYVIEYSEILPLACDSNYDTSATQLPGSWKRFARCT